jgi:hypothetical protein
MPIRDIGSEVVSDRGQRPLLQPPHDSVPVGAVSDREYLYQFAMPGQTLVKIAVRDRSYEGLRQKPPK